MTDQKRTLEPNDRVTRIEKAMLEAAEQHPEFRDDDKCVIFMRSEHERMAGTAMAGYGDEGAENAVIADLLIYLRRMFRAQGKDMHFMAVGIDGE